MSGSLDYVSQFCAGHNSTEISECLSHGLRDSGNVRSVDEVWMRSFGIHIAALASFGHLMSLQGRTTSLSDLILLFCYFEFPEVLLAQMLIRCFTMTVRRFWQHEEMSKRFFVAACLGCSSTLSADPKKDVPLTAICSRQVRPVSRNFGILLMGRIGLLLTFLVQYTASVSLWIRLVFYLKDRSHWFWHIDMRTFEIVVGGLLATMSSLLILVVSDEWVMVNTSSEGISLERTETSQDALRPPYPNDPPEIQIIMPDLSYTLSEKMKRWNGWFSDCLAFYIPHSLQNELELGIVLQRVFAHGLAVYTLHHRFPDGCPPILHSLSSASSTFDWTEICPDRANIWDPSNFTHHPRSRNYLRYMRGLEICGLLFTIGVARILAHWVFGIVSIACRGVMGKTLPSKLRFWDRWFLSGRTMISFPLVLLLFSCSPLWIMSMLEQRGWVAHAQSVLQRQDIPEIDRIAVSILMWKDPWYDRFYVI
ncbi:unnamed protein product [Periconia digitata]|uniref:Uncharacterized protein n=1 Tax=Periconia digitata TaxID=1303443 RepID=A0A9W4XWN3_9PLEO|nr:unnamed protein product [Periconia digitata]